MRVRFGRYLRRPQRMTRKMFKPRPKSMDVRAPWFEEPGQGGEDLFDTASKLKNDHPEKFLSR